MPVEAFVGHAPLTGFNGLGLQNGYAGAGLARGSRLLTLQPDEYFIKTYPLPSSLPAPEIIKADRVRWKVIRQQPPLAAALRQVEQRIQNQAQRVLAAAGSRQAFFDNLPLGVGQVGFVHLWSD